MKAIVKALSEKQFRPRAKWWGFQKDGKQILCRYHHVMAIFENGNPTYLFSETRTDKAGVNFAVKYMKDECNKVCPQ